MIQESQKLAEFIKLDSPEEKLRLVCLWTQKCYERGETAAVHLAGREEAERLDGKLWTFEDRAFIPHVRFEQAEEPVVEPVVIYCEEEPLGEAEVLIEAAGGEPSERFRGFDHVFDFAETYDEHLRELSRRRYTACREAGYRMRFIEPGAGRRA